MHVTFPHFFIGIVLSVYIMVCTSAMRQSEFSVPSIVKAFFFHQKTKINIVGYIAGESLRTLSKAQDAFKFTSKLDGSEQ